ncbi:serine hydrolase [Gemmatimonadota bacterium]
MNVFEPVRVGFSQLHANKLRSFLTLLGHSGYTGTSIWIDYEEELFVILLTNRVHPDDRGSVVPLRSKVSNVVAASIIDRMQIRR